MTKPTTVTLTSTADTQPDGLGGYRKSIGGFLAVVVTLVTAAWADGSITSAEWGNIGLASASAAIATFLLSNSFKPVEAAVPPTPAANLDPDVYDDVPGEHAEDNPNRAPYSGPPYAG